MLSLHSPTACGGIGVGIIHMAPAGDSVGGGVRRGTTIAGTIPVIGVAIGVVTGAAGMAAATGDTIITIIPDGVAEDIIGRVIILIPTAVLMVLLVLAPLPE